LAIESYCFKAAFIDAEDQIECCENGFAVKSSGFWVRGEKLRGSEEGIVT